MNIYLEGSGSTGWNWDNNDALTNRYMLTIIKNPSKTILVADDNSWWWGFSKDQLAKQSEGGRYYDPENKNLRGFRHGKGANFLFVDGHVSMLTPQTIEDNLK